MSLEDDLIEGAPAAVVPGPAVGATGPRPESRGLDPTAGSSQGVDGVEGNAIQDRQVFSEGGVCSHHPER